MNSATVRLNDEEIEILAISLATSPTGSGEGKIKQRLVVKVQTLKDQLKRKNGK